MVNACVGRQCWVAVKLRSVCAAVATCAMVGGCGSGSVAETDGGKDVQSFIGTWMPTSGAITFTCAGAVTSDPVTGNDVWQMGTTSDVVQPADSGSNGCVLLANVSGNTATALANQSCNGATTDINISMYTFVVGSSGMTATENATGTASVTTGGTTTTCSYSEAATYTKSQ